MSFQISSLHCRILQSYSRLYKYMTHIYLSSFLRNNMSQLRRNKRGIVFPFDNDDPSVTPWNPTWQLWRIKRWIADQAPIYSVWQARGRSISLTSDATIWVFIAMPCLFCLGELWQTDVWGSLLTSLPYPLQSCATLPHSILRMILKQDTTIFKWS